MWKAWIPVIVKYIRKKSWTCAASGLSYVNNRPGINHTPALLNANLTTLIQNWRTAAPRVDLFLVSPADTGDGATPMAYYDQETMKVAVAQQTAYLSLYQMMQPYADNKARHTMTPDSGANDPVTGDAADNGRHLTDIGTAVGARKIFKFLRVE